MERMSEFERLFGKAFEAAGAEDKARVTRLRAARSGAQLSLEVTPANFDEAYAVVKAGLGIFRARLGRNVAFIEAKHILAAEKAGQKFIWVNNNGRNFSKLASRRGADPVYIGEGDLRLDWNEGWL